MLAWLLDESTAPGVIRVLDDAEAVYASDLTVVECDRALIRAARSQELTEADAGRRRAALAEASAHWTLMRVSEDVVMRARREFPVEPVRTLDAVQKASAMLGSPVSV